MAAEISAAFLRERSGHPIAAFGFCPFLLTPLHSYWGQLLWRAMPHALATVLSCNDRSNTSPPRARVTCAFRSESTGPCRETQCTARYLDMAALANTDAYAAKLFDESHLWLDALPDGVLDLLREHPAIAQAWSAGSRDGFHLGGVFGRRTDEV